jgi:uncharacterized protein
MLIEYKIANYRSISDEQIISLVPSPKQKDFEKNVLNKDEFPVLNCLAFYGKNSGGKSNVLKSFELLNRLLYSSTKSNSTAPLPYDPFLLREGYETKPCKIEITFITDKTRYRYGLEYNKEKILKEWLYRKKTGREVEVFDREGDIIEVFSPLKASPKIIDAAIEATRDNALFLSFCDLFNIDEAKKIFKWFDTFNFIDGLDTRREAIQTIKLLEDKDYNSKIKEFLQNLELGFEDVLIEKKEFDPHDLPETIPEYARTQLINELRGKIAVSPQVVHNYYDTYGKLTDKKNVWSMEERESEGSKKIFHLSGPVLYTLMNGGVLVVDEIEAKIHTLLTINTINLFLNKKTNPNNAQLIFATHDTNLLKYVKLRRDQINFIEKNEWESTVIYSLSDIKYKDDYTKERHDTDKEKDIWRADMGPYQR